MAIVPKKTDRSAYHGAAEDRELRAAGEPLNTEILAELAVRSHIRESSHGGGGDDHQADREPVQPVRQIDGIRGTRDYDHQKQEEETERERIGVGRLQQRVDQEVRLERFEERHVDDGGVQAACVE